MSINSIISTALSTLNLPLYADLYQRDATEYITFNYSARGANFADNAPNHEIYYVQVHYVCPNATNSLAKRTSIKQLLFGGGFTWPETTDATDGDGQHWVFECQYLAGVDADG